MQKENPHRVDTLRKKHKKMLGMDRGDLITYYDVAMKFAPRVMSCDVVMACWLEQAVTMKHIDIQAIRTLCMTERIHRELSA